MAHKIARHCFIPWCNTGNSKNYRSYSLFSGPKDPDLLSQWIKNIPRKDKKFSVNDAICSLHFDPSDVLRQHVHEGADGQTIILGQRKRPSLRQGAIPSIFPETPKCITKVDRRRKVPLNRSEEEDPWKEKQKLIKTWRPTEKITFVDLKNCASSVELPSPLWAMQRDPEGRFVSFNRLASTANKISMEIEVGVLFEGSCVPIVFLRGKLVDPPWLKDERHSLGDVSFLLSELDSHPLCLGTGYAQQLHSNKCHILVSDASARCRPCRARRSRIMSDTFRGRKLNSLVLVTSKKQVIQENRILRKQLGLLKKTVEQLAVGCINKTQSDGEPVDLVADVPEAEEEVEIAECL